MSPSGTCCRGHCTGDPQPPRAGCRLSPCWWMDPLPQSLIGPPGGDPPQPKHLSFLVVPPVTSTGQKVLDGSETPVWPGPSLVLHFLLHKPRTKPLCLSLRPLPPPTPVRSAPGGPCGCTCPRHPYLPNLAAPQSLLVIPLLPEPHHTWDVLYAQMVGLPPGKGLCRLKLG